MNFRSVSASMVMAAALLSGSAVYASPFSHHNNTMSPSTAKTKTVSLSLRNDSSATIKVKAGAAEMTLAPGQTAKAKLNVGDQIVAEDGSTVTTAGTVIAVVAEQLNDSTIVLR
jgi:PDZ domain-containing secreted protein